jgi:Ser/Thr protein kinase RdoA (MazF antagonist)
MAWSADLAMELGGRALSLLGLESATLTLLKFGTIANFRVDDPLRFLKIADPAFRSAEPVLERSLALSAWLDGRDFPVAAAAEEGSARPVAVNGAWAGLWLWQDQLEQRADPRQTGELLRRFHELLAGCPVSLPELNHLEIARRHIGALSEKSDLGDASIDFLLAQSDRLEESWGAFQSDLGVGAIHGDFEIDNVLATDRGPVLVDLDNAQVGPWEWDLVKAAPGAAGGWREEEWPAFVHGYGYDVLTAPGAEVLRDVRHLRSLVWLLGDPRYADRFARGKRLLAEWIRKPEKRCFVLDWLAADRAG